MTHKFRLPFRSKPSAAPDPQGAVREAARSIEHAWRDELVLNLRADKAHPARPQWDPRAEITDGLLTIAKQLLDKCVDPEHFARQMYRWRRDEECGEAIAPPPRLETLSIHWLPQYKEIVVRARRRRTFSFNFTFGRVEDRVREIRKLAEKPWLPWLVGLQEYAQNDECDTFDSYLIGHLFAVNPKMRFSPEERRQLQKWAAEQLPRAASQWRRFRDEFDSLDVFVPPDFKEDAEWLYREAIGRPH